MGRSLCVLGPVPCAQGHPQTLRLGKFPKRKQCFSTGGIEFSPNTLAIRKGKIGLIHRRENAYTSGIECVCVCICTCVSVCRGGGLIRVSL